MITETRVQFAVDDSGIGGTGDKANTRQGKLVPLLQDFIDRVRSMELKGLSGDIWVQVTKTQPERTRSRFLMKSAEALQEAGKDDLPDKLGILFILNQNFYLRPF